MKNKFLALILALSLILAIAAGASAETSFKDVLSPDHDWAADKIEEMTDLGIIKGYGDGTFRPDKAVSKIEALILFARVSGYSNTQYSDIADFAYSKYEFLLEDLDIGGYENNKTELAFAVYKHIISDEDIISYLEDDSYSEEFPRYDAAMLLTNLMGADVSKISTNGLDFKDLDDIPKKYLPYVAYVYNQNLMNGVENDDGDILFNGETPLTRAQVSVLLYRILDKLDMTVEKGTVTGIKKEDGILEFINDSESSKSYVIKDNVIVLIDGMKSSLDKVSKESNVTVVRYGKEIYSVEALSPSSNMTLSGTVTSTSSKSSYMKLALKVDGSSEEQTFYTKGKGNIKVTNNGVADEFSSIKPGDYVVVKFLDSEIVSIDIQSTEATVQGVIDGIDLTASPLELTVTTTDETTQRQVSSVYKVNDDATVRRDEKRASLRDILIGDKVVLTISKGVISKISATSSTYSFTGTITSITIASQAKIKVASNGDEREYAVSLDSSYVVGGKDASIYDLRLGNTVTLSVSGGTVTKIEQTTSSTATTKSGTIESTSSSYAYINIITSDGVTDQIFASRTASSISAKIIDGETGKDIAFKNLKAGDFIIATGSYSNGAFVAKTIVVTPAS